MEVLITIIFIGILVYQFDKIDKLNAKVRRLQKELKKYKDALANQDANQSENKSELANNQNKEVKNPVQTTKKVESKPKMDAESSRNLSILVTGSILIVLAAIAFLTTAWYSIPSFIKTIVLFLVAFVFIGASKISKEKYNLEKASKTFFYIGMAYLPICFLSISIFGLFGDFLSVNGEGKYIYLGCSTLILSFLYYFIYKSSDDKYLLYGSLLSQILSVILFTLMFEERLLLVCINLLLYNLLLIVITKDTFFEKVISILPALIAVGVIYELIGGFNEISWYFIISSILLAINMLCLEVKKTDFAKAFAFNIFLFLSGFTLIFKKSFNLSDGTCQVLITLFTTAVFVLETLICSSLKNNKNLLLSNRIITIFVAGYIYIATLSEKSTMIIPSYIIAILFELLLIYDFKSTRNLVYKYLAYAFTNILLIDITNNLLEINNINKYVPMITTTFIMVYEMFTTKKRDFFLPIYLGCFEALSLLIMNYEINDTSVVLGIIFSIFVLYNNKKTGINEFYNAVPLLCILPCIINLTSSSELEIGILLLGTVGVTYFSVNRKNINIYTIISIVYLVALLDANKIYSHYLNEIILIVWAAIHTYFYDDEKIKDIFKVLTLIFVTVLYYSIVNDLKLDDYTIFKLLGIVVTGMYILKNIISKYNVKDIEVLEYIFWGLVYFSALGMYVDSTDGIIFSILILAIIFYSYYKKYGATFLAGIAAILVNGFALTREFWFSIPWWIYLLVVGGILVGFAVKNEANENKQKISVGSILKQIKDKVEK